MLRRPCFLLCALLSVSAALAAPKGTPSPADLQKLQQRIEVLNQHIAEQTGSRDALRQELETLEQRIHESSEQALDINAQVAQQAARVQATQQEQQRAQASLDQHKAQLAQQVRSAYLVGEAGQLRLLLSMSDLQRLDRMTVYYQYLGRARAKGIAAIQQQLDQLTALQDRLAAQQADLEALQQKRQAALEALRQTRGQRQETMAQIAQRIQDEQAEVKQLQASEREMQKLLRDLREALNKVPQDYDSDGKPFAKLKGKLPWPIRGKLLAAYGDTKAGGRVTWNGYWIAAADNAPVRAVANGRVAYVGWLHRYGLIVILEHDDGYFTLYGHNTDVAKTAGEKVKAGELIAHAGATGGHDKTGVYFEIRKGTDSQNPKLWLAK